MDLKFDIEKTPPGSEEINAEKERLNSELTKAKKKKSRMLQAVAFCSLLALATLFTLYFQGMIELDAAVGIGAFGAVVLAAIATNNAAAAAAVAVAAVAVAAGGAVGIAAGAVAAAAGAVAGLFLFTKITDAIDGLMDGLDLLEPARDELSPEILVLCQQNEVALAYQNALPRPKRPLLQGEYLAMKAWVDGAQARLKEAEKARDIKSANDQLSGEITRT